jgi:hypothetical protein
MKVRSSKGTPINKEKAIALLNDFSQRASEVRILCDVDEGEFAFNSSIIKVDEGGVHLPASRWVLWLGFDGAEFIEADLRDFSGEYDFGLIIRFPTKETFVILEKRKAPF